MKPVEPEERDVVFPPSYARYFATLGPGTDGDVVTVWSPARIATERGGAREWIGRRTWDAADALVDLDPAELVLVGETRDGDRIAFHPRYAEHVLWLRVDVGEITDLGTDLQAAVDEICGLATARSI